MFRVTSQKFITTVVDVRVCTMYYEKETKKERNNNILWNKMKQH